jgi:uncharacterized protein YjeT (DUF2065 family)
VLGLSWIAAGAIVILYTDESKTYFTGLVARLERLWLAMIPAGFGLLLLIAAPSTTHSGFIGIIGFLGILKGFLVYFNPGDFLETGKTWLNTLSGQGYRLIGIISLVLGTVVISWIR